jgi:L-fuconate dehydratase
MSPQELVGCVDEHEHFVAPVAVGGSRCRAPETPGYGIELRPGSLERHGFPAGAAWAAAPA